MGYFEPMVLFAARYAHAKPTSAANAVVNYALENWHTFSPGIKDQLIDEARKNATCNRSEWKRLAVKLEEESI
jgi:hypothetical protein